MQYRPVLLLLSLLLLKSVGCSKHTKLLKPFDYITGELIDLDGDARAYQLTELKPSTGYEVRLSFPASVSTCNSRATLIMHLCGTTCYCCFSSAVSHTKGLPACKCCPWWISLQLRDIIDTCMQQCFNSISAHHVAA
jgi:hypothetical protein